MTDSQISEIAVIRTVERADKVLSTGSAGVWTAQNKRLQKCTYILLASAKNLSEPIECFMALKNFRLQSSAASGKVEIYLREYAELKPEILVEASRNPLQYLHDEEIFQRLETLQWEKVQGSKGPSERLSEVIYQAKNLISKELKIPTDRIRIHIEF